MNIAKMIKNNRGLLVALGLMAVFRSAVADWYHVPTGSMKPSIVEGDQIGVVKMAYDLRVPFTHTSLMALSSPKRGDVVVFDSVAADTRMVKRVVGLPGETVSMTSGALYIDGQMADYQITDNNEQVLTASEKIGGMDHPIQLIHERAGMLEDFEAVKVPEGHFLVLGDNRRNSSDSRVYGFVPRAEIVGQATRVMFSLNYDNHYLPRSERFFKPL